ncbi:MAG: M3 family metallopeptidase [Gammaproteobacteria bacterium]|nr:M3 family metallopeptidase [Gammaproteobacteria bacterium]
MNQAPNPFLQDWDTPFGIPQFDQIKTEHYLPAFEQAMDEHLEEVNVIATSQSPASFQNTIEALELSGSFLNRVASVFFNLTSSDTSDELQEIELNIRPRYAAHQSGILTNNQLFSRVESVFNRRDSFTLTDEQHTLLEETYRRFIRAGAALAAEARDEVNAMDEELSRLATTFGQNVLKETNDFELVLDDPEELAGLPDSVLAAASREAMDRGHEGKYVFTISRSSITPLLQFSERRDLREKIYTAYVRCADNGNARDNNDIVLKISSLRSKRANLLGFASHAHYMLDDRMAKTPESVQKLLRQLWQPACKKVRVEADDLQSRIQEEGGNSKLAPWDWWYYTEKIRAERYDLDDEKVKPYFELGNVRDGAFHVANRLYGLTFTPYDDLPAYHEDVQAYEVKDADGSLIGLFLVDYFMRPSKRGGAWMSNFREQSKIRGEVRPIVVNVCNFPKGSVDSPSLLGFDEVRTLFHEFGHALHGLLSQVTYESLSGPNVKQDFVELPSQIMEHWALETEVMKEYARHYETGEAIPDELIKKIHDAEKFNQGFATTEYLAASFLDMDWHSPESVDVRDVTRFEERAMQKIDLIPEVTPRYRSTYFQHIFTGDSYSAGYYAYIWAEVLDADGYAAFKEKGLFDQETARSFRQNILENGGTADPMELYKRFRGREPEVAPLLEARGLD